MPESQVNPAPDPLATKSYSVHLLVSTLLLMLTLVWAIYDEVEIMRPYKEYQARFRGYYTGFLMQKVRPEQAAKEEAVRSSAEYRALDAKVNEAEAAAANRVREIDTESAGVTARMTDARGAFQILRSEMDALRYLVEVSHDDEEKDDLRADIEDIRQRVVTAALTKTDGSGEVEEVEMKFDQLEDEFLGMQTRRAELQAERLAVLGAADAARQERDAFMSEQLVGLNSTQIDGLITKMRDFPIDIKQIHLSDIDLVDRCESCHLGIREPVAIGRADLRYPVFQSHPRPELLKIHDPEGVRLLVLPQRQRPCDALDYQGARPPQVLALPALPPRERRSRLPAVPRQGSRDSRRRSPERRPLAVPEQRLLGLPPFRELRRRVRRAHHRPPSDRQPGGDARRQCEGAAGQPRLGRQRFRRRGIAAALRARRRVAADQHHDRRRTAQFARRRPQPRQGSQKIRAEPQRDQGQRPQGMDSGLA